MIGGLKAAFMAAGAQRNSILNPPEARHLVSTF
jgi:hypothetical protein